MSSIGARVLCWFCVSEASFQIKVKNEPTGSFQLYIHELKTTDSLGVVYLLVFSW